MNYNPLIHPSLKIASFEPPSTPNEIRSLREFSPIQVPDEYINLISQATDLEFASFNCCFRIWGASGCIEMNQAYELQHHIPTCLAIGDNETGSILAYVNKNNSLNLYLISLSNLDIDDILLISANLSELIYQGKNIHLLI
jgi:hypothetical protein